LGDLKNVQESGFKSMADTKETKNTE